MENKSDCMYKCNLTYLRRVEVDWEVAREELEDVLGVLGQFEVRHHQRPDAEDQVEVALPSHECGGITKRGERVVQLPLESSDAMPDVATQPWPPPEDASLWNIQLCHVNHELRQSDSSPKRRKSPTLFD